MTDTEKFELDRWLEWAGGQVNTWRGALVGGLYHEARARKDGEFLRAIEQDRYAAISRLKAAYETKKAGAAASKVRCASCPQDAVEEFKVRCSDAEAAKYGVTLTGNWIDTASDGSPIREETVALCARCMAVELRRFLSLCMDVPHWLKTVRAKP